MPDRGKAYLNDNVRTEHLKCTDCRTQIFLVGIKKADDGSEIRNFACPHCRRTRSLRLPANQDLRKPAERAVASEHSGG